MEEKHVCEYGCGKEAPFQFKNGKWCCSKSKNSCSENRRKHKEDLNKFETRKKQSESALKQWSNLENRRKHSEIHIISMNKPETKIKIIKSSLKRWSDPVNIKKLIENLNTPEAKKRHSESLIKRFSVQENRNKNSKSLTEHYCNPENKKKQLDRMRKPETRKKCSESGIKRWSNLTQRNKASKTTIKLWKDFEYVEKQRISHNVRPNKPETIILDLLNKIFPNEWKYTGDFSFMINGKNPDFTNHKKKKVIEFFGRYWHDEDFRKDGMTNIIHEEHRIKHFERNGYKCLIIWENEFKEINKIIEKIMDFELL